MKKYFMVLGVFMFTSLIQAQDKLSSVLKSLPHYNFDKGVGITSPDSLFQMNLRFRLQNRLEVSSQSNEDWEYQALIRRLRWRFDGYLLSPRITYAVQLSFAPNDVGKLRNNGSLNIIRDAVVFYKPNSHWSIGFGQTKIPGNQQRVNSSGALQFTDRSINNSMFNIDRDFGFLLYYLHQKKNRFGYDIKTSLTTGAGRNNVKKRKGLAYTARLELYPLGSFQKNGAFFEGDLMREQHLKLYFGGTLHYNHMATASRGQQGTPFSNAATRNLTSILLDASAKYRGWAFATSYMSRSAENPIVSESDKEFVEVGSGWDVQLSYLFDNNWEIAGRFSDQTPDNQIYKVNLLPQRKQSSLVVTKYFLGHNFKAQVEVMRDIYRYYSNPKSSGWTIRCQVEIGI